MRVDELWLTDFRSYREAHLEMPSGLTVVVGENGQGKTNLLEAIGYASSLRSFRGAPGEALVRAGCETAVVRALTDVEGREVLVEAELRTSGRGRVLVNKQRLQRARDLLGLFQVSVFAPDDLALVKDGPSVRRQYLDDALVARRPALDAVRSELDGVLRQRNALLKSARGRMTDDVRTTLAVWNRKMVGAGEELARARVALLDVLAGPLAEAYDLVAGRPSRVEARYESAWIDEGLAAALERVVGDELRRGVTLAGPHRDELLLTIGGLPARTHASQGEQRSLTLALRLAVHRVVTEAVGSAPVLLLDDIFSELDPARSAALFAALPPGQVVLSTATDLPPAADPDLVLAVDDGVVAPR